MSYIKMSEVYKVYGKKVLAIDNFNLEVEKNEFVALIGPSGCGKSTLLRMIAGLEEITYGTLTIDDKVMNNVHAKDRDMAMVFQNYALYPHMDIFSNIAFGLKLKKMKKEEVIEKVNEAANMLGLTEYLNKRPSELSGGQRQRVALGRAIVQLSRICLMDEPLSNLDAKLRNRMRAEILLLHRQFNMTTIYVTHDQVEAMTMADKIVILKDGKVCQIGKPHDLYYNPSNLFVAKFIGEPEINCFNAKISDGKLILQDNVIDLSFDCYKRFHGMPNREVIAAIRAEDFLIDKIEFSGVIELIEMRGDHYIVLVNFSDYTVSIKRPSSEFYQLGDKISFGINPAKILFFDPKSGERL